MEPERRIEKLLRAFSKKRREQAGDTVELRPASRQQLHKEISRRSLEKSGGSFFSNFFPAFRPGLAFAICFIAIVAVGGWLLLPGLSEVKPSKLASANSQLAKEPSEQSKQILTPVPTAPSAPVVAERKEKSAFDDRDGMIAGAAAPKPEQPYGASANSAPIVPKGETFKQVNVSENGTAQTGTTSIVALAPSDSMEMSLARASTLNKDEVDTVLPAASPSMETNGGTPPALALTDGEWDVEKRAEMGKTAPLSGSSSVTFYAAEKEAAGEAASFVSQNFNRMDAPVSRQRAFGALSVPAPVLASFRVEESGGKMRVVDADGSVYTGAVQVAQEEVAPHVPFSDALKNEPAPASAAKVRLQSQAARNYFFRVAGTNRNLNQNIVFSGNLIPLTNFLTMRTNVSGLGGAAGTRRTGQEPAAFSPLLNSKISGKAMIGDQKEIEVNATPTP